MKTKFYALLASAALIAQAKAGGHGGGGASGGSFAAPHAGGGAPHAAPAFHSAPRGSYGGGRFMAPGRFSSYNAPMAFRQERFASPERVAASSRQFSRGTVIHRDSRLTRNGNNSGNRFENRVANAGREHLFARRSADWHRDWDRRHDHWWHGHRCHFVNGSWFIYDIGFYPYDYYGYPYGYDADVYDDDADYYGQRGDNPDSDSAVAAAQEELARQGSYRGEIDGVFGPATRRAIIRYQSNHGLRVTGTLNVETLRALGLPRVADN